MSVGTNDAALAQALEKHQMSYVKRGLAAGILSGMTWGLQGVLLWSLVLVFGPFAIPYSYSFYAGLVAAVSVAALHDFVASMWILLLDAVTGRIKEIPRALKTKPGRLAIFACIFGGPLGMGGYVIGMYLAGVTYALAISAVYPAIGALLGRVVLKERISGRVWMGIVACLLGAVLVGWAPPEAATSGGQFYLGIAFAACPAVGWAAEGVISCFGMDMIDPDIAIWIREFFSSLIAMFTTVIGISIFAAAITGGVEVLDVDGTTVNYALHWYTGWQMFFQAFADVNSLIWIIIAAASGGFSYVFWYRALNMIGTGRAMAFNVTYALWSVPAGYLVNLITPLYGWENGYSASGLMLIGVAVITVGAILVVINPKELLKLRNN
jgi:drug/metabolite transporter (DMT)-like permease